MLWCSIIINTMQYNIEQNININNLTSSCSKGRRDSGPSAVTDIISGNSVMDERTFEAFRSANISSLVNLMTEQNVNKCRNKHKIAWYLRSWYANRKQCDQKPDLRIRYSLCVLKHVLFTTGTRRRSRIWYCFADKSSFAIQSDAVQTV